MWMDMDTEPTTGQGAGRTQHPLLGYSYLLRTFSYFTSPILVLSWIQDVGRDLPH